MSTTELSEINGVNEGIEYRIKDKIRFALSFKDLVKTVKTKRYTWTRLQRMFIFILTNTKKSDLIQTQTNNSVPYVRLLGMTKKGQKYLNSYKEKIEVPVFTQLKRNQHPLLTIEEKASDVYYSILPMSLKNKLRKQELNPPIIK